jgi:hypothetical protein
MVAECTSLSIELEKKIKWSLEFTANERRVNITRLALLEQHGENLAPSPGRSPPPALFCR